MPAALDRTLLPNVREDICAAVAAVPLAESRLRHAKTKEAAKFRRFCIMALVRFRGWRMIEVAAAWGQRYQSLYAMLRDAEIELRASEQFLREYLDFLERFENQLSITISQQ